MPCCCCCCCCCCLDCARPWRDALCCAICGATLRGASRCCDAIIMSLRLLLEASYRSRRFHSHAASACVESDKPPKQLRLNKLMEDRYVPRPKLSSVVAIWYLLSSSFCRPPSPFFPLVSVEKRPLRESAKISMRQDRVSELSAHRRTQKKPFSNRRSARTNTDGRAS